MDLNHVTLPSANIDRSIAFYETLGLHLIVHTHDAYCRFKLPNGDATFSLHLVESIKPERNTWIYFEIDTLDEEVKRLQGLGIKFAQTPTNEPWGWREAKLEDPDGNNLILYKAGNMRKNPPWRKQ